MVKEDCIYFEEKEKDTEWNHCLNSHRLDNKDSLCDMCRLWDSYIPSNSTPAQIEKAQKWQRMSYLEQPDYDEYFSV